MAKRIDLRAYQDRIAARLAAAQAGAGIPALLGFESGGTRWLVDLPAAGEVLALPSLTHVPQTRSWFIGLASVHGELQGVVDFALFCGAPPTPHAGTARLLRIGVRHGNAAALLVARVHGIKRTDMLFDADDTPAAAPPWHGRILTDNQGERWTRLETAALLADPTFLDAALPDGASASGIT